MIHYKICICIVCLVCTSILSAATESSTSTIAQPSSQPTQYFQAPSIPTSAKENSLIAIPDQTSKDHYDGVGRADNINEELKEETRTAINGATYILYTFLIMVGCVFIAYLCKKCVSIAPSSFFPRRHLAYEGHVLFRPVGKIDLSAAAMRYQPVQVDDHEDLFTQHDLEPN